MLRTALVCLLGLTLAASADAAVNVLLEASPPATGDCYVEGEVVNITVTYQSSEDIDMWVRLLQFSNLGMAAAEQAGFTGDYLFDTLPFGGFGYNKYPMWSIPAAATTATAPNESLLLLLTMGEAAAAGHFAYTMPDHSVLLDIMNSGGAAADNTARIRGNFDTVLDLWPGNGGLTGGTIELCIPEPASLGLLSVGALFLLRRRR